MSQHLETVRQKLKGQVPLVQHLGVDIVAYEPGRVVIEAPLEPNINTHGTAFGGSLYCIATMCGWSLVHLTLMDAGYEPNVWVTKGEVVYHAPVKGVIRAVVQATPQQCAELVEQYAEKARARLSLEVAIHQDEQLALTLNASFAAR